MVLNDAPDDSLHVVYCLRTASQSVLHAADGGCGQEPGEHGETVRIQHPCATAQLAGLPRTMVALLPPELGLQVSPSLPTHHIDPAL